MTLNDYQTEAAVTAVYDEKLKVIYPALGLGEAGEVQGKIKKIYRDADGNISPDKLEAIKAELGDLLWYVAVLARDLCLTLDEIGEYNIAKLRDRQKRNVIKGDGDNR